MFSRSSVFLLSISFSLVSSMSILSMWWLTVSVCRYCSPSISYVSCVSNLHYLVEFSMTMFCTLIYLEDPWIISLIMNFLSHSLQIRPLWRSSFPSSFFALNNRVFLKQSLHVDFPQKWQWEFCNSVCFFHGFWHVLHYGVFLYSLWLMGLSKKKMFSSSSNRYSL